MSAYLAIGKMLTNASELNNKRKLIHDFMMGFTENKFGCSSEKASSRSYTRSNWTLIEKTLKQ